MPTKITTSGGTIPVEPLTPDAFAEFGTVIQNPSYTSFTYPLAAEAANQGSATKYADVSPLISSYQLATSTKPAHPKVSLFACQPRTLTRNSHGDDVFGVKVLERHPFTPQTFVPLGLAADSRDTAYLVVVAPTLPLARAAPVSPDEFRSVTPPYPIEERPRKPTLRQRIMGARPNPFTNDFKLTTTPANLPSLSPVALATAKPKGPGPPDLTKLRAFVVSGDQAVTYGAGTWHAPMVVLGERAVDFVVVQYVNGVALEDCQEVEVQGELGVIVPTDAVGSSRNTTRAKL